MATEPIVLSFKFSEEFVVEAMSRQRRVKFTRTRRVLLTFLPACIILPVAVLMIFELGQALVGALLLALTVFMFAAHHLDYWIARRRHRRSPHCNDVVCLQFSPERVQVTSRTTNSVMQWEVFTRSVVFEDGILLYQGPILYNWLPYRCLEDARQSGALAGLVRERLGDRVSQQ